MPGLPPILPVSRSLGCTWEGEGLNEESHPYPTKCPKVLMGSLVGAREARSAPGKQRPGQKFLSRAAGVGRGRNPCPYCCPAAKMKTSRPRPGQILAGGGDSG